MFHGISKVNFDIDQELLKKYEAMAWNRLNIINCRRVNNISIVLVLFTIASFLIDYLNKEKGLWTITPGFVLLFYNHIVLEFGALFLF